MTHDEALTWELYLAGPVANIFNYYDANHHFLATLLERVTTGLLGSSELTLRLPTLLAAALYFTTVFRLALFVFGETWLFMLAVVVLSANPLLLDFLVAARGYGLALALFLWALFDLLRYLCLKPAERSASPGRRRLHTSACALLLAVAANLVFLFPVAAVASLFLLAAGFQIPADVPEQNVRRKKGKAKTGRARSRSSGLMLHFVAPLVALAVLFFISAPLSNARTADFYYGSRSLLDSLRDLVQVSLAHNTGVAGLNPRQGAQAGWLTFQMIFWVLAVMGALVAGVLRYWRGRQTDAASTLLFLAPGVLAGSLVLLVAAHYLFGFPYPADRTGLYFLPLAPLCLLAGVRSLVGQRGVMRMAGYALAVPLALVAAQFLVQWNTDHFYVWRYDADSKTIMSRIEPGKQGRAVRVWVSWQLGPSFSFYRTIWNRQWIALAARVDPAGDYDYYALIPEDQPIIQRAKLRPVYRGPGSGTVLALAPGR